MTELSLECGDPNVAGLLTFVAARAEEDRSGRHEASPINHRVLEMCNVVEQVLLDMAREVCRAGEPCSLPQHCLRALGEYASGHRTHPDFRPAWLGWRLLP